jgi:hypothetical protein
MMELPAGILFLLTIFALLPENISKEGGKYLSLKLSGSVDG